MGRFMPSRARDATRCEDACGGLFRERGQWRGGRMGKKSKGKVCRGCMSTSPRCRVRTWGTLHVFWEYRWRSDPRRVTGERVEDVGEPMLASVIGGVASASC